MKLLFISLGCDKNLVDTEHMLSMITKDGITITNDENEADVVVVNSCCFISDAMEMMMVMTALITLPKPSPPMYTGRASRPAVVEE